MEKRLSNSYLLKYNKDGDNWFPVLFVYITSYFFRKPVICIFRNHLVS